jgi:hypothetical protein
MRRFTGHEAVAQALVTAKLEAIECEGRVCTAKRSETRAKDEIVRLQRQLTSLTNELHMVKSTSTAFTKVHHSTCSPCTTADVLSCAYTSDYYRLLH